MSNQWLKVYSISQGPSTAVLVFIEFLEGRERFVGNKIREKCSLCYSFVMKRMSDVTFEYQAKRLYYSQTV